MKFVIAVIIIVGLSLGAWQIHHYWGTSQESAPPPAAPAPEVNGDELPGLPARLEPVLEAARQRGATGLHDFLRNNGKMVEDPRLAWIQLDYVLLVAPSDPAEARKVFAKVKERLSPDSPVYPRMKQLEKTYE